MAWNLNVKFYTLVYSSYNYIQVSPAFNCHQCPKIIGTAEMPPSDFCAFKNVRTNIVK